MMNFDAALAHARALPDVTEREHFGSYAFGTTRNFATFWREENRVNVRLSLEDQRRFLELGEAFQEIDNAWGRQGWTTIRLELVDRADFRDAVAAALAHAAVKSAALGSGKTAPAARKKKGAVRKKRGARK